MTDINSINISAAVRILSYAVGLPTKSIGSWKKKLKYLHVCPLWRDIAAPLVLNEGYIELDHYPDGNKSKTNIYIILSLGGLHLIDDFSINTISPMAYSDIFQEIFTILGHVEEVCHLHTVTIDIAFGTGNYSQTSTSSHSNDRNNDFVNLICEYMPYIRCLTILESESVYTDITNRLFERYSNQLIYLYSLGSLSHKIYRQATKLTFLRLRLSPYFRSACGYVFNPATLTYLSLSDVPANYDWHEFMDELDYINFSNLETLEMSFLDVTPGDTNSKIITEKTMETDQSRIILKKHFPSLKQITLSNCSLISAIDFKETWSNLVDLHTVSISGSVDSVESVVNDMNMTTLQPNILNVYIEDSNCVDKNKFVENTNHLFDFLFTKARASFVVDFKIELDHIDNVMWPNLTNIIINSVVDADVFLVLATNLSNLQSAMARNLRYNILPIYKKEDGDISAEQCGLPSGFNIQGDIYSAFSAFVKNIRCGIVKGSREYNLCLQKLEHLSANRENRRMQTMSLYFSKQTEKQDLKKLYIVFAAAVFPSVEVLEIDSGIGYISGVIQRLSDMIPHFAVLDIRNVDGDMALEEKISELNFF